MQPSLEVLGPPAGFCGPLAPTGAHLPPTPTPTPQGRHLGRQPALGLGGSHHLMGHHRCGEWEGQEPRLPEGPQHPRRGRWWYSPTSSRSVPSPMGPPETARGKDSEARRSRPCEPLRSWTVSGAKHVGMDVRGTQQSPRGAQGRGVHGGLGLTGPRGSASTCTPRILAQPEIPRGKPPWGGRAAGS